MARRSAAPSSGPSYVPHPSQRRAALAGTAGSEDQSAFSRFIQTQIFAPDKLPGNINIITGVGMFIGGILATRTWGELMVPA